MSCLRYLCLSVHSGVQHILCCVFVLFFFVLLPVSLDCSFLIVPLVLSNVYLSYIAFVISRLVLVAGPFFALMNPKYFHTTLF
jgi:hypothetical protein